MIEEMNVADRRRRCKNTSNDRRVAAIMICSILAAFCLLSAHSESAITIGKSFDKDRRRKELAVNKGTEMTSRTSANARLLKTKRKRTKDGTDMSLRYGNGGLLDADTTSISGSKMQTKEIHHRGANMKKKNTRKRKKTDRKKKHGGTLFGKPTMIVDANADVTMDVTMNPGTIVDIAVTNQDLSALVAAVTAAALVETLSGHGPFTVFAPTNEAFAALPTEIVNSLLLPENIEQLQTILKYHVIATSAPSSSLVSGDVMTVNGDLVTVAVSDAGIMVNDANVITADIMASNGIIHVIDKVLLPTPPKPKPAPSGKPGLGKPAGKPSWGSSWMPPPPPSIPKPIECDKYYGGSSNHWGSSYDPCKVKQLPTHSPTYDTIDTYFPTFAIPSPSTPSPSTSPSTEPSNQPSSTPSQYIELYSYKPTTLPPSDSPTLIPTLIPTVQPTEQPTLSPTYLAEDPTIQPTMQPTVDEDEENTDEPTLAPTRSDDEETKLPTFSPTYLDGTDEPTSSVSDEPTSFETDAPTSSNGLSNLWAWGEAASLGEEPLEIPIPKNTNEFALDVSTGSSYTLYIGADGVARAGGIIQDLNNYRGHLGLPDTDLTQGVNEARPILEIDDLDRVLVRAPKFRNVTAGVESSTGSGLMHSIFIDDDGRAYAAGNNNKGQLCLNDIESRFIPTQIVLPDNEVVKSAVVGGEFTLILTSSGNLFGCGSNEEGQLGLGETVIETTDATFEDNFIMSDVLSISAGQKFALVSTSDGLFGMGDNTFGQLCLDTKSEAQLSPVPMDPVLELGSSLDVISVKAGKESTYILLSDGSVIACGRNDVGQLGDGTSTDSFGVLSIASGGDIVALGSGPSASTVFYIYGDGTVSGNGLNDYGQLGNGNNENEVLPVDLTFPFGSSISYISAADDHTVALGPGSLTTTTSSPVSFNVITKAPSKAPTFPPIATIEPTTTAPVASSVSIGINVTDVISGNETDISVTEVISGDGTDISVTEVISGDGTDISVTEEVNVTVTTPLPPTPFPSLNQEINEEIDVTVTEVIDGR